MLCIKDEELAENKTTTQTTQNTAKTDNEVQTKLSVEATSALLEGRAFKSKPTCCYLRNVEIFNLQNLTLQIVSIIT